MEVSADLLLGTAFYGIIGYLAGWFFKGDGHLRDRFGFLLAFFITYIVFIMVVFAAAQIADLQNWIVTLSFSLAFAFRFFVHRG